MTAIGQHGSVQPPPEPVESDLSYVAFSEIFLSIICVFGLGPSEPGATRRVAVMARTSMSGGLEDLLYIFLAIENKPQQGAQQFLDLFIWQCFCDASLNILRAVMGE